MTGIHHKRRTRSVFVSVLCITSSALLGLEPAQAVVPDQSIPDIPVIYRPGVGVRALGMSGAVSASMDEYSSLNYNPATLALVRRTQITGSLERRSIEEAQSYERYRTSTSFNKGRLHSIGFAYPYPTYRGALVIGFGYDVVSPLDSDYLLVGRVSGVDFEKAEMREGALGAWTAGFAVDVSPRVSLGAAGTILRGSYRSEGSFYYDDPFEYGIGWGLQYETKEKDLAGVSGRLGALVRFNRGINLGLVLHMPERIERLGTTYHDLEQFTADGGVFRDSSWVTIIDERLTLPFRMTGALAYTAMLGPGDLTLGTEATFADWKEIDYAGRIRARGLGYAYRSTVDTRVGAEYTFSRPFPVSLRGGFASIPLAYRPINVDVFRSDYEIASIDRDRRAWALGLGVQVDPTLRIDLAYVRSSWERSGRSMAGAVTEESVRDSRLLMGVLLEL